MRNLNSVVLLIVLGLSLATQLGADDTVTMNGLFKYEWCDENNDSKLVFIDEVSTEKYLVELSEDVDVDDGLDKRVAATGFVRASEDGISTFVVQSWKLLKDVDEDEDGDGDLPEDPNDDDDDEDEE